MVGSKNDRSGFEVFPVAYENKSAQKILMFVFEASLYMILIEN
jgi:hypothetical protein